MSFQKVKKQRSGYATRYRTGEGTKRVDNTLGMYVSQLKKAVALNNQKNGQKFAQELSRVVASKVFYFDNLLCFLHSVNHILLTLRSTWIKLSLNSVYNFLLVWSCLFKFKIEQLIKLLIFWARLTLI
jgi:hypothetical protein